MMLDLPQYDKRMIEASGVKNIEPEEIQSLLQEYTERYTDCFFNKSQRRYFRIFLEGLLSNLDRKSIEPIALAFCEEKEVRGFQQFFKRSLLPDEVLKNRYQEISSETMSAPGGMLSVDGSDFVKKGTHSVGVARQYCGRLGKTENCQAGIFAGYASERGYGLVNSRLYIPECWFSPDYEGRRKKCLMPESLKFQTKNEIASELLNDILAKGQFQVKWIGCDAAFGCDHAFLKSLPDSVSYFASVKANELIFKKMPKMTIPESPIGKSGRRFQHSIPSIAPVSVKSIAEDDSIAWSQVVLAQGAKGSTIADVKCIRCASCVSTTKFGNYIAPAEEVWVYIRKYADRTIKYFLSNAPANTPLKELHRAATMRWPIEQCFEECKSYLGMSHYESRTYLAWHRHMQLVMIAHLFTLLLRVRFKKTAFF